jgi:hypothetical protein
MTALLNLRTRRKSRSFYTLFLFTTSALCSIIPRTRAGRARSWLPRRDASMTKAKFAMALAFHPCPSKAHLNRTLSSLPSSLTSLWLYRDRSSHCLTTMSLARPSTGHILSQPLLRVRRAE